MAWNTEETRQRLREAAATEFAANGLDGTTMEQIARRAGVNKERLYNYFGDKRALFATVLAAELEKVAAAVPIDLEAGDVGDYAGRLFDYHVAHPELVRLLHWEALAYGEGEIPGEPERAAHYREKVEAFAAGQGDGRLAADPDAAHLVFEVLAIVVWWSAVPQVARLLTGAKASSRAERARRRAAVVELARRLAAA